MFEEWKDGKRVTVYDLSKAVSGFEADEIPFIEAKDMLQYLVDNNLASSISSFSAYKHACDTSMQGDKARWCSYDRITADLIGRGVLNNNKNST